jgi:hypothetical protein
MNDVAMPIKPNSDQASTADAGMTTSRRGLNSRSASRREGVSIAIAGISAATGAYTIGVEKGGAPVGAACGRSSTGGGDATAGGRSVSNLGIPAATDAAGARLDSGALTTCSKDGAGSGSRGCSEAREMPRKNSASTRRSSGRRSIRSAGIPATASSSSVAPAGFWDESGEAEPPTPFKMPLVDESPAPGESGPGTTKSALHLGQDTIEPAFPGAEAKSWLHR